MMQNLTTNNFETTVASGLHLIDFWAPWCGPCRMQTPILEELSNEYSADQIQISKVNVDEEGELALKYQVQSIPTMLVIRDGRVCDRLVGVHVKPQLIKEINSHI